MPEKYTDPTEKAAWEIFVQLVGRGKDVDTAVPDAFDAVERFDHYCDERRKKNSASPRRKTNLSIEGDDLIRFLTDTAEQLEQNHKEAWWQAKFTDLFTSAARSLVLRIRHRGRDDLQRRRYSIYRRSA